LRGARIKNHSHFGIGFCGGIPPAVISHKKKDIAMPKEVVINTPRVNSYGFRVLTSGMDVAQYRRNPILLWQHSRAWRGEEGEVLPIGRMERLRVEGDKLIGTPVFDEADKFAKKIKAKWDGGFLRMVSAGLDVVETSAEASAMLPGQVRPTVTKSRLREVSVVDIGANDDALTLYHGGRAVCLAEGLDETLLDEIIPKIPIKNQLKMKTIALKLGLAESATEGEVLAAIGALQGAAAAAVKLQKEVEDIREKAIESEVDAAIKLHKITADKRAHFVALGKSAGVEALRTTLECVAPAVKPTDVIAPGGGAAAADGDKKSYAKLSDAPAEERAELRRSDPEEYRRLYKAEYGIEAEF
jgi:hypothetical protein